MHMTNDHYQYIMDVLNEKRESSKGKVKKEVEHNMAELVAIKCALFTCDNCGHEPVEGEGLARMIVEREERHCINCITAN